MGLLSNLFGGSGSSDVDWYCDSCDAHLNKQSGFSTASGTWTCTNCSSENDVTSDNILSEEEAEMEESFQKECPNCSGHMARGQGYASMNVWVCEECGTEAKEDGYGLLWTDE